MKFNVPRNDFYKILQKVINEGLKWSLRTITKDGDEIYELKLGNVVEALKAAKEEIEPSRQGGHNVAVVVNFSVEEKNARINRLKAFAGKI